MSDAARTTYTRDERGAWIPTDDPTSIARVMTAQSRLHWFPINAWSFTETLNLGRDTQAVMPSQRGESSRRRLSLNLNTEQRRFHSIRAEGVDRISGGLTLEVYASDREDEEIGGRVRHWPPHESGEKTDDLLGTMIVREAMILKIIDGLRTSKQVDIGLQISVFKEAIAHSFDEGWMLQDLYVPYGENIVIDAFQVRVTEEHGTPIRDVDTPPPSVRTDDAESRLAALHPELIKRMNWALMLLAAIAVLLVVR